MGLDGDSLGWVVRSWEHLDISMTIDAHLLKVVRHGEGVSMVDGKGPFLSRST